MQNTITRRTFIATSTAATVGALSRAQEDTPTLKTTLKKALVLGRQNEKGLEQLKTAGFDGYECGDWNVAPDAAAQARKLAQSHGIEIHSVMRGWCQFNSGDQTKVDADIASVEKALRASQAYGAGALLVVPCRTGGMPIPQPWEFDIEMDAKTCHITRVVDGDNSKFQKYIDVHNQSTDASRKAVERLIPVAKEAGVVIALENVWNNLWVKPEPFAAFVKSFDSEWVKAYFDIGNHVKYALPEEWIRALGKSIARCHVKDFRLNENGQGGKWADIRDGSVNWPLVRRELDALDYNGWLTIEGSGGLSMDERGKRLDLICAGK